MSAKKTWNTGDQVLAADLNNNFRFGGTGADGALSISSGTTTLSLASAAYFEKNYTTISITGTANLAFSSPNNTSGTSIALKTTGNWTMTSSSAHVIDLRQLGGGLGSAVKVADNGGPSSYSGLGGSGGGSCLSAGNQGGVTFPTGGGASFAYTVSTAGICLAPLSPFVRYAPPSGSGCSGGSSGSNGFSASGGGAGGLGACGLYCECGGAWNFTTGTIDGTGQAGSTGASGGGGSCTSGCGGGGAGANILVLWGSLTADSGTYSVTAGAGGTGTGSSGAAGATGATWRGTNTMHS